MSKKFTVCVLLYGDYPNLAERCLGALFRHVSCGLFDVRVGCNEVSAATLDVVRGYMVGWSRQALFTREQLYFSDENICKYPMMRRMFYSSEIATPYVMWFDDDSWIQPTAPPTWFADVAGRMQHADMLGSIWQRAVRPGQPEWISSRAWYKNKPVHVGQQTRFITGGWWTIRTDILKKWDWPDPEINHCGGDQALGILCDQQGYRVQRYEAHLAINANDTGKCSTAPRRGVDEKLVGEKQ